MVVIVILVVIVMRFVKLELTLAQMNADTN